jgi:hypothetical protein
MLNWWRSCKRWSTPWTTSGVSGDALTSVTWASHLADLPHLRRGKGQWRRPMTTERRADSSGDDIDCPIQRPYELWITASLPRVLLPAAVNGDGTEDGGNGAWSNASFDETWQVWRSPGGSCSSPLYFLPSIDLRTKNRGYMGGDRECIEGSATNVFSSKARTPLGWLKQTDFFFFERTA